MWFRHFALRASLRSLAAVLAVACSAVTLAGACADDVDSLPVSPDASLPSNDAAAVPCPASMPSSGSNCALPEGTTCDFGGCGTRLARCTGGVWRVGSNSPPVSLCPDAAPNEGVPCPPCWSSDVVCRYGSRDCTSPDASENRAIASCPKGAWRVAFEPCRDAGPDVQGDGGPDAD